MAIPLALSLQFAAVFTEAQQVRIEPRVSAKWEYSDNLFLAPDNAEVSDSGSPLEPVSDSALVLTPGLAVEARGRKAGMAMHYDVGRVSYDTYPELDRWRHKFEFDADAAVAPGTTLTLRNTFLRTEDPLTTNPDENPGDAGQAAETGSGFLSTREPYSTSTTTTGIKCEPGDGNSFSLAYRYGRRLDKANSADSYTSHRGSAQSSWLFSPDWQGVAEVAYNAADFDNGDDASHLDGGAEIRRRLPGGMKCFARYHHERVETSGVASNEQAASGEGYTVLKPETGLTYTSHGGGSISLSAGFFARLDDHRDDTSGFSGKFEMARSFTRSSISLHAAAGHDEQFYARDRFDSSTYSEAGTRLAYSITDFIRLGVQASYRHDKYDTPRTGGESGKPSAAAEGDGTGFSVALDYKPRDWIAVQLSYGYTDRFSFELRDNYTENRLGAVVTLGYPWTSPAATRVRE